MAVDRPFWSGRSVLVTGAAGLLGGWVCRALVDVEAIVVGLDIDWSRPAAAGADVEMVRVDGDVRSAETLGRVLVEHAIGTVVHLAAQTLVGPANDDPAETFDHNVRGTWVMLEACRRLPGLESVVVASSDKAYGDHGGRPYVEDMALRAEHPYAASKTCTDVIAQTYAKSYGMPVVITRCGNMYGGGDLEWSRIVPGTIRSVLLGERPVIRSDGRFVREYFYVEDAAHGVLALARAAAEHPDLAGEAFNFGSETTLSALEMVDTIVRLMGCDLEPDVQNDAVNEIPEQRVSAEKAREVLGWSAAHTLQEGLKLTIDWYRSYLSAAG
jgi:CDP-glucose 4,6-dehydratase